SWRYTRFISDRGGILRKKKILSLELFLRLIIISLCISESNDQRPLYHLVFYINRYLKDPQDDAIYTSFSINDAR
ncbi:MAG: hypothetical protein M3224_04740, partial [Thermoproteota archaeon]|nr:hypothetical protein [Thermoproteota archaeon]